MLYSLVERVDRLERRLRYRVSERTRRPWDEPVLQLFQDNTTAVYRHEGCETTLTVGMCIRFDHKGEGLFTTAKILGFRQWPSPVIYYVPWDRTRQRWAASDCPRRGLDFGFMPPRRIAIVECPSMRIWEFQASADEYVPFTLEIQRLLHDAHGIDDAELAVQIDDRPFRINLSERTLTSENDAKTRRIRLR